MYRVVSDNLVPKQHQRDVLHGKPITAQERPHAENSNIIDESAERERVALGCGARAQQRERKKRNEDRLLVDLE